MEFFMKKSILASSIAAAVFGMGAVGAQAMTVSATTGDSLIVPYFTTQANNATLLSITNTDTVSGKAVKVRFRGAANSDDIFDFQVFLSPTDVWTANISKGADGLSRLTTSDTSCTKPSAAVLNATPFITSRLDQRQTGDALAAGTREGYIEIIGMADIPPSSASTGPASAWAPTTTTAPQIDGLLRTTTPPVVAADLVNPLFTAIKHVKGVAPCTGTAFTALDSTTAFGLTSALAWTSSGARTAAQFGLAPLRGGLIADWSIVNTVNAAAWGGQAIALQADSSLTRTSAPSTLHVNYAPQIGTATGQAIVELWSADPLFMQANEDTVVYNATTQNFASPAGVSPVFAAGYYDLPDLSTSFSAKTEVANALQAQLITDALSARSSIMNEFATESSINGSTDWVFSMPTRRYSVAMAYANITATNDGRVWNRYLNNNLATTSLGGPGVVTVSNQFGLANTSTVGNLICVSGARPTAYDREEQTNTTTTAVVVSPSTVAGGVKLCGEASVLAFNNGAASAAVNGAVAVSAVDVGYSAGWATMSVAAGTHATMIAGATTGAKNYPIAGGAFQRAAFGAQGFGIFRPFR
jgi:hypothetical protein